MASRCKTGHCLPNRPSRELSYLALNSSKVSSAWGSSEYRLVVVLKAGLELSTGVTRRAGALRKHNGRARDAARTKGIAERRGRGSRSLEEWWGLGSSGSEGDEKSSD